MAIEVFNRYENKYLLDAAVFDKLTCRLSEYMELDAFNRNGEPYPIASLYYDTADHYLVRTSLAKPKYKEKLRLRAYGVPDETSLVYVEIKKKVYGLTNKRRSAMGLSEAYDFLRTGQVSELKPTMNAQVLGEIGNMLQRYALQPSLHVAYDRWAYFGVGEHDLRVSFDCNIRSRQIDLDLEAGNFGDPLLRPGQWLMEVKSARSIPVWLSRLLSEYSIYPTSFSKVGVAYLRTLARRETSPMLRTATALANRPAAALVIA